MTKQPNSTINFNYEVHVKELIERFTRLVKQLGPNNRKDWKIDPPVASIRYEFETDFMYALNEIKNCPPYLQGKMFDNASGIINALTNQLRNLRESSSEHQEAQDVDYQTS